jgi:predicted nuclease of predicted toxin-antitoxin system
LLLLFDQNTPLTLRRLLPEHSIRTAHDMGWSELTNGDLLAAGEAAGFEVLVTLDKRIRYQQNLEGRKIGIVVLPEQNRAVLEAGIDKVRTAIELAINGAYVEFDLPRSQLNRRPPPAQIR